MNFPGSLGVPLKGVDLEGTPVVLFKSKLGTAAAAFRDGEWSAKGVDLAEAMVDGHLVPANEFEKWVDSMS